MKTRNETPTLFRTSRSRLELTGRPSTKASTLAPVTLRRILVATDFSEASLNALRCAVRFARPFNAALYLVHVIKKPSFVHGLENVPLVLPEAKRAKIVRIKLASLAKAEISKALPLATGVYFGEPSREIVALARQVEADLIVLATQGRTGLPRMLLGSTAEQVIRHAPCPVLVVRERARSFNPQPGDAHERHT
jgi:universal stress protein A